MNNQCKTIPSISEWFENRNVFITGATGFMGKVLLSKLLMSCPDIGKIYLLIREKKGVDAQHRLTSIMQEEPFRKLRMDYPKRLDKLTIIPGDITLPGMNLSKHHKDLLKENVSVVFHGAANVKFDMPLREAITMNTKGMKNILELCKEMKGLQSLVHISTAYTHCSEAVLEDRAYPSPMAPEQVLDLVEILDDDSLNLITPKLLKDLPNTYAFSKSLAENLINRSDLPAGVARPSIASWKEPVPGWVESLNGPTGLLIGAAKGVIRSVLCDQNLVIDAIPCDIAINAIIALAWKVGLERPAKPIYMNITESGENPLTWGESLEYGKKHTFANPFTGMLWYPGGGMTTNKYLHGIAVLFLHLVPAYFIDLLCFFTGNKPFMVKIQARVSWGLKLLEYYTIKQWIFRNDGMKKLRQQLTPADKEVFYMDTKAMNWNEFMKNYVLGVREFVLKEDPATLPHSRKIFQFYYIGDLIVRMIFFIGLAWFLYSNFVSSTSSIQIFRQMDE